MAHYKKTEPVIRDLESGDHHRWRVLWHQYLVFYETTPSEAKTDALWLRLMDDQNPVEGLAAHDGTSVVGGSQGIDCKALVEANHGDLRTALGF